MSCLISMQEKTVCSTFHRSFCQQYYIAYKAPNTPSLSNLKMYLFKLAQALLKASVTHQHFGEYVVGAMFTGNVDFVQYLPKQQCITCLPESVAT